MRGTNMLERPFPETYWVQPSRLLAGPYPGSRQPKRAKTRIDQFLASGITYFVDLTESGELPLYRSLLLGKARYKRFPIPDFDTPTPQTMRRILDVLDRRLLEGDVVYVHCRAGLGRTGIVIGCYLVRHGLSGQEALRELWRLRQTTSFPSSASPETETQRRMVLAWNRKQKDRSYR
jgi:protein-tyrosine phosphatase